MKLVPTSGLMAGIRKALRDQPEAADALLRIGLFESLTEQIDEVRQPLAHEVVKNMGAINAAARRAALRAGVSKALTEEELSYLDGLALADEWTTTVEKGLARDIIEMLRSKAEKQPRDDRGRFVRGHIGSSTSQDLPMERKLPSHMTEAVALRDRWVKAGLIGPDTMLTLRTAPVDEDGHAGQQGIQDEQVRAGELEAALARGGALPVELAVARRDLNRMTPQQLAAIDLAQLATGSGTARSKQLTAGLFDGEGKVKNQSRTAERWYGETNGYDRRTYRRIGMTGEALSSVSTPGSTASMVGGVAQLVGDLGPEAEKVLGPGLRRTAYRYRGTERRPDRSLYTAVQRATAFADGLNRTDAGREKALGDIATGVNARGEKDIAATVASNYTSARITDDQRDLRMRGDTAVASLLGLDKPLNPDGSAKTSLPDLELTELSLASGEVPPSEGVIIDAHGRVLSQAVGYNGDHYLPFDLKNLNGLYGGQYVRTRASGGPTIEDFYTALVTGARQFQVVSNSGVFTVELDPDLRGARRFNDKVARMTQRYGEMLETLHTPGHGMYENDLPPEQKLAIRQRAAAASRTDDEYKATVRQLTDEARVKGKVRDVSDEELEEAAYSHATHVVDREMAEGNEMSRQQRARRIEEEARAYIGRQDPGVRELQLNGEGYNRALKALKQEFPYYIRSVTFEPLPQFLANRGMPRAGYKRHGPKEQAFVERGQTNTLRARTGAARSARLVPTKRRAVAGTETSGEQPAAQQTQTQSASTKTPSADAPTPSATAGGLDLVKLTGPEGQLTKKLGVELDIAMQTASQMPPSIEVPEGADNDRVMRLGSYTFFNHMANNFLEQSQSGQAGTAAARWLLTEASPREREVFLDGLSRMQSERGAFPNFSGPSEKEMQDMHSSVTSLIDLAQPFATPAEGQEPWQIVPKVALRPAHFDEVPALDAPADEWDHAEARLRLDEYQEAALDDLAARTPTDRMAEVQNVIDEDGSEDDIKRYQLAWSFLHARDVANKLHQLAGSDAGPKAAPGPQREVGKSQSPRPHLDALLEELAEQVEALRRQ